MKKIIALLLSLLMAMQLGTAFAEEQTEVLPDSPDMVFATSIGIFEEGTDQTAPLTRIGLAAVFYNILMSDVEPYMDYSKYFTDVSFDIAAYADFVYQCGIMNGVGDGLFEPDSNVTYAQVLKTVVAFLGYTELAQANGGYPYGYIAVAQKLDLIDSVPPSIDSIVTVNKVASIFRLATNVPLMERVTYGSDDVKYEIKDDSDYLETYMDITRIRGIVTGNYLVDYESGEELEYGQVKISDEIFYITEATNDIINNLGCEVDIYAKSYETSKTSSIMYYEFSDLNSIVTVDGDNIKSLSSNKIVYYDDDDKEKNARIDSATKVIYNGSYASSYDEDVINPFDASSLEGTVKFIDNDNDGTNEVVIVDAYRSYIVKNVVNNVIFNELLPEETIDLGATFKDGDIEISNVIGQPIMLSQLEEGDVISVSRDLDGNIKKIVVTIDTFSGTLKGINESDSILDIDGNLFEMSRNFINNPKSDFDGIKLGTKVTLYFNKDGKVSDIKASDSKHKTGYAVAAKKDSGINDDWKLRIFTATGEFNDVTLAEKIRLSDGGKVMAEDVVKGFYGDVTVKEKDETGKEITTTVNEFIRQVVLYDVNEEGKLSWIDKAEGTEVRDGLYMMEGFDGTAPKSLYYRSSQKNFGAELLLSAGTVVFNVPSRDKANDWSSYYVETSSYYSDGTYTTDFIAYSTDKNGGPCAEFLVEYDGTKSISSTADAFVIDKVSDVIDENGEEKVKISGYIYDTLTTYYGDKSEIEDSLCGETLERGDIIRLNTIDGEVKSITKVFDFDKKIFLTLVKDSETDEAKYVQGTNPTYSNYYYGFRCTYGEVVYNDGLYIKVRAEGTAVDQAYPLSSFKIVEIDFSDDEEGVMRTSSTSRVFDTQNYPGYSSKVVIQTRNGDARTLVLYNGLGGAN